MMPKCFQKIIKNGMQKKMINFGDVGKHSIKIYGKSIVLETSQEINN